MVRNQRRGGVVEPVAHGGRRPAERHRRQTVRQGRGGAAAAPGGAAGRSISPCRASGVSGMPQRSRFRVTPTSAINGHTEAGICLPRLCQGLP